MAATAEDIAASGRLYAEVLAAYAQPTTKVHNDNQLHQETGIARETLKSYFKGGAQPDAGKLRIIADALGLDVTALWCRWLGISLPDDSLRRIAEALERAFPAGSDDAYGAIDGLGHDPMPSAPDATRPARSTVARRRARSST